MARQNKTLAATVATFPVSAVGLSVSMPSAYTLLYIYARTRAVVSATTEVVAKKFFLTLIPWKISKMTAEIVTNLDFLAPVYKKMAKIIAQLLKKV